jgi:hypothetical protein
MSWISVLLSLLTNIPKLISLVRIIREEIEKHEARQRSKEIKEAVDETTRTRDQRREEEAMGHSNPGAPSDDGLNSVQTRPVKDRS